MKHRVLNEHQGGKLMDFVCAIRAVLIVVQRRLWAPSWSPGKDQSETHQAQLLPTEPCDISVSLKAGLTLYQLHSGLPEREVRAQEITPIPLHLNIPPSKL